MRSLCLHIPRGTGLHRGSGIAIRHAQGDHGADDGEGRRRKEARAVGRHMRQRHTGRRYMDRPESGEDATE